LEALGVSEFAGCVSHGGTALALEMRLPVRALQTRERVFSLARRDLGRGGLSGSGGGGGTGEVCCSGSSASVSDMSWEVLGRKGSEAWRMGSRSASMATRGAFSSALSFIPLLQSAVPHGDSLVNQGVVEAVNFVNVNGLDATERGEPLATLRAGANRLRWVVGLRRVVPHARHSLGRGEGVRPTAGPLLALGSLLGRGLAAKEAREGAASRLLLGEGLIGLVATEEGRGHLAERVERRAAVRRVVAAGGHCEFVRAWVVVGA
jgi:hypothetical protein